MTHVHRWSNPCQPDRTRQVAVSGRSRDTDTHVANLASYPGSCVGGEKRAWYRPFAHALNYKLKNHVYVANDV